MQSSHPRRFWKEATVTEAPSAGHGGWGIALDGRPVRVPSRQPLILPSRALAEAVAEEWNAQGETMNPHSMPLTQLANTAQDRVMPLRAEIISELLAHAGSEVLCYRAEAPVDLTARQAEAWNPLLAWATERVGCAWVVTSGLMPVDQPAALEGALRAALEALDAPTLTAVQVAAPLCGSLILALALAEGRLGAAEAHDLAHLDEMYQVSLWGEDREALRRRANIRNELADVERYLGLVRAE